MKPVKKSLLLAFSLLIFIPTVQAQLAISPNGRHLVRPDGHPFYWFGDTGWALLQKIDREEVKCCLKATTRLGRCHSGDQKQKVVSQSRLRPAKE